MVLWPIFEARGWYQAAIELSDDLLGLLAAAPDSPDRWQQELTLMTKRARAMMLLRGYTAEVEDAYADALAIVREHGEVPQIFPVLRSLGSLHALRGEFDKGIRYSNEILRLAGVEGDGSMIVDGYSMLGCEHRVQRAARDRPRLPRPGDRGIRGRRLPAATAPARARPEGVLPDDVGVLPLALGLPGSGGRPGRACRGPRDRPRPPVLARVRLLHAGYLHLWRREAEVVQDRAQGALRVAETNELPIWRALATCLLGAATSARGRPEEGLRQMADGLNQYEGMRTPPVFWPLIRFMQAAPTPTPAHPGRASS